MALQPAGPFRIVVELCRMLPSIHFNDQFAFQTGEIHNVRAHRVLPPKTIPVNLP
jgi:hypothetical protein